MAIIPTYPTFRWYACDKVTSAPTATFADLNPDTVGRTDLGGDFAADGVVAGMVTRPSGTASNDGFLYTVDTVAANLLTLVAADAVVAEGPVACALTSYWLDRDGFEEFPGAFGHTNKVRSGGFSGGFTGIPQPWIAVGFDMTVNAYAADAVPGTDEYHWYLSQRTDDPAKQYVSIVPYTDVLGQTYSGSVTIDATVLATTELGMTWGVTFATPTNLAEIFKMCDLYCIRVADGSIQWINLFREMIGAI